MLGAARGRDHFRRIPLLRQNPLTSFPD
jgi:hypothetical protein